MKNKQISPNGESTRLNDKLDAFMAVEVMEWHKGKGTKDIYSGFTFIWWRDRYDEAQVPIHEWHSTTDPAQALMCAEKYMHTKKGYERFIVSYQKNINGWVYEVTIEHVYYENIVVVTDKSQPLAICQAIFKAMEGDK